MQYSGGSQVWVNDNQQWTPGVVCDPAEVDAEALRSFGDLRVLCVRLYRDEGNIYSILEPSGESVLALDWARVDRGEDPCAVSVGLDLLSRARLDFERRQQSLPSAAVVPNAAPPHLRRPQPQGHERPQHNGHCVPQQPRRSASAAPPAPSAPPVAFSNEELRRIREYLEAIEGADPEEAANLRAALQLTSSHQGFRSSQARRGEGGDDGVMRVRSTQEEFLQLRERRQRLAAAAASQPPLPPRSPQPPPKAAANDAQPPPQRLRCETRPEDAPAAAAPPQLPAAQAPPPAHELRFRSSCGDDELAAIRQRIAYDQDASAAAVDSRASCLDPCFKLRAVMGAVIVEGLSCRTKVSVPQRDPHRSVTAAANRILAVALGPPPQYDPAHGWMEPLHLEADTIVMRVAVDGRFFAVPRNWQLPSTRSFDAVRGVKTLIPIDVTEAVDLNVFNTAVGELATVDFAIHFSTPAHLDLELWHGTLAVIIVDVVPVAAIVSDIAQQYVPPQRLYRPDPNCIASTVSLTCPLSSQPLRRPCRGLSCEHFQCMELDFLVAHCLQRHVWACPLCHAPIPIAAIAVDERLLRIIEQVKGSADLRRSASTVLVEFAPSGAVQLKLQTRTTAEHRNAVHLDD